MFVESYHAGGKVSCRSRSGFLVYMHTALLQWFSKKRSTVETSVLGAEFVTMKQGIDAFRGLRYKLMLIGIPISDLLHSYRNNLSVIRNTSQPELDLRKKSNLVCYHAVHESVTMGESLVEHIPSKENFTDLLRKVFYGHKERYLVSYICYEIHDDP